MHFLQEQNRVDILIITLAQIYLENNQRDTKLRGAIEKRQVLFYDPKR